MNAPQRYTRVGSGTVVEAVVLDPANLEEVAKWSLGRLGTDSPKDKAHVKIPTRKYVLRAYVGDVVIKEVINDSPHFMISDAEVFEQNYTLEGSK